MSVICSNCGKSIPYHGTVCPYCHANKAADKAAFDTTASYVGAAIFGAIFGTLIGYQAIPGGGCYGLLVGPVVGLLICFAFLSSKNTDKP